MEIQRALQRDVGWKRRRQVLWQRERIDAGRQRPRAAAEPDDLAGRGISVRSPSSRGVAEEAPGAYKDVDLVAEATEQAGLARRVAFLRPKACIKG